MTTTPGVMRGLRRWRFTLVLLGALLAAALLTGTVAEALPRFLLQQIGFAPRDLWALDVLRLLASALVTWGGWVFAGALVFVAIGVGAVEARFGPLVAAAVFWGSHVWTLVVTSFATRWFGDASLGAWAGMLSRVRDVGPSAGYFGAIGFALCAISRPRLRAGLSLALLAWLCADLLGWISIGPDLRQEPAADFAHLVAFVSAWLACSFLGSRLPHPGGGSTVTTDESADAT